MHIFVYFLINHLLDRLPTVSSTDVIDLIHLYESIISYLPYVLYCSSHEKVQTYRCHHQPITNSGCSFHASVPGSDRQGSGIWKGSWTVSVHVSHCMNLNIILPILHSQQHLQHLKLSEVKCNFQYYSLNC